MPVIPLPKTTSEQVFGEGRTSPSVFDSKMEQLAKKVMRVLGMDNPPDPASTTADFMNPLGIPGAGGVVRLGQNIAGAGLRDLRLSPGEMVRAVRELLEHGRFRAFHGTPDPGPIIKRRDPFHIGTADAAMERIQESGAGIPGSRVISSGELPPGSQIFPIDVSFSGGLRGSSALHSPARPVIGRPTEPLTDEMANIVGELAAEQYPPPPFHLGRVRRPQIPEVRTPDPLQMEINERIRELNRGDAEALLYQNTVEHPGSLSLSILDPVGTDVRIGDPLDVEKLFRQRESLGLPSSSRRPESLWKFKGR